MVRAEYPLCIGNQTEIDATVRNFFLYRFGFVLGIILSRPDQGRGSTLAKVSAHDRFPDEVPVADAVEQLRPVLEPDDQRRFDSDERDSAQPERPLESGEADWQEQQQIVADQDQDENR